MVFWRMVFWRTRDARGACGTQQHAALDVQPGSQVRPSLHILARDAFVYLFLYIYFHSHRPALNPACKTSEDCAK